MNEKFAIEPLRLIVMKEILGMFPGTDARAQRQRLLVAIERLQSVCTFECSRCLDIYFPPARKRELLLSGYP
jgi:Helix-turn-helix domain